MPTLPIRGATLQYVEQGHGEPLVLIHGSVSDRRTWGQVQPELARHFRTIAYSRRYHWPNASIPAGADYAMLEHVDDLDAAGARPAHLVGHPYGAYVALLLAIRRPESVRSLVLAEPPCCGSSSAANRRRPIRLAEIRARQGASTEAAALRRHAGALWVDGEGDLETSLDADGRSQGCEERDPTVGIRGCANPIGSWDEPRFDALSSEGKRPGGSDAGRRAISRGVRDRPGRT